MGFLARLFGAVPKGEQGGIRLADSNPWRVDPTKDVERFIRALPALVPDGAIAYFEGTGESHVEEYLLRVSVPARAKVAVGTIWPRPDCYHVPLTAETMEALARFLEQNPTGYFCTHCHVYLDGQVLLEWHDAFFDDPLYVSHTISRDAVERFAQALGSSYTAGWAWEAPDS
jgi:hypothetical protein